MASEDDTEVLDIIRKIENEYRAQRGLNELAGELASQVADKRRSAKDAMAIWSIMLRSAMYAPKCYNGDGRIIGSDSSAFPHT